MRAENAILVELFRHNLWANDVMLDACRDLSDAQLATELEGTYGRLDQTLVHLARAQGGYPFEHWPAGSHVPSISWRQTIPFPALTGSPSTCASPASA